MDSRYKELNKASGREVDVNVNRGLLTRKIVGDSDTMNVERVLEIERELLRRWKSGDAEAYLPEFGSTPPNQVNAPAP